MSERRPRRRRPAVALTAALVLGCAGGLAGCSADAGTAVQLTPSSPAGGLPLDAQARLPTAEPLPAPAASDPAPTGAVESRSTSAEGSPTDVLTVYPGAQVLLSSAVPASAPGSSAPVEVTLAASTTDAPEAVLEFYRRALTGAGFTETPSSGGEGVLAATFTRGGGAEVLSVAVAGAPGEAGRQQFTVGGRIAAP